MHDFTGCQSFKSFFRRLIPALIPILVILYLGMDVCSRAMATQPAGPSLSEKEYAFLNDLARDTWNCMDYFRASETGFPFDSNLRPPTTNTTNVGLYLVSVTAAEKLGFITGSQARCRIIQILKALKRIDHWHGFLNNHLDTRGKTKAYAGPNAISDFNKLAAALLVVRQAYPDIKLAHELFDLVEWSALWKNDRFHHGYDVASGALHWWGHGSLASDARMAVFLGVATGGLPAKAFTRLERRKVKQYGVEFYRPAWDYAGIFMHAMSGVFLDERLTDMGFSTANFAYAQMLFAREKAYPVWGWSACDRPGQGYTVHGLLSQEVVTPHASALVIDYYPRRVLANLKALESLGCRRPFEENGRQYAFGFWDSINVITGEVSHLYLTGLDQAMLFISLANFLQPNCVRRLFMQDPVVQKGLTRLEYLQSKDESRLNVYARRDAEDMPVLAREKKAPFREIMLDDFEKASVNSLDIARCLNIEKAPNHAARIQVQTDPSRGAILKIEYDLRRYSQGNAIIVEPLNGLDAAGCNALAFWCRAPSSGKTYLNFRLRITDSMNSRVIGFIEDLGPEWQEIIFPFEMFRGILADTSCLKAVEFRLERTPCDYPDKQIALTHGTLYLDNLRLVRLTKAELQARVRYFLNIGSLTMNAQGQAAGLTRLTGWQIYQDADAHIGLEVTHKPQASLKITYDLGANGKWVACEKPCKIDLSGDFQIHFEIKGSGSNNTFEVKLFSAAGAVFGKHLHQQTAHENWQHIVLGKKDIRHLWGGKPGEELGVINKFGTAVSGQAGTKGTVEVRNLVFSFK